MIVVLKEHTPQQLLSFTDAISRLGVKAVPIHGEVQTVLGLVGDTARVNIDSLNQMEIVEKVIRVQEPFKLAGRKFHPESTVVPVGEVRIGDSRIAVMAGPCSVESEQQMKEIAADVKASGAVILRGGAYKPRSSPYAFQGLHQEGLDLLSAAGRAQKLPIVSEITNIETLDRFEREVDIIQVGARSMQNFELLKELGHCSKPVLLKRGFANTVDELLMSAEYILSGGNENVILCERGIRTFETRTRNTLDISAIPVLKKLTHLPVVVDPSHASGHADLVGPLALAAVAAGADGLIIEVHNNPSCALCDGAQSLNPVQFDELMKQLAPVAAAVGRSL